MGIFNRHPRTTVEDNHGETAPEHTREYRSVHMVRPHELISVNHKDHVECDSVQNHATLIVLENGGVAVKVCGANVSVVAAGSTESDIRMIGSHATIQMAKSSRADVAEVGDHASIMMSDNSQAYFGEIHAHSTLILTGNSRVTIGKVHSSCRIIVEDNATLVMGSKANHKMTVGNHATVIVGQPSTHPNSHRGL